MTPRRGCWWHTPAAATPCATATLGCNGAKTLALQHESPGAARAAHWLPVPRQPFQAVARLYWPRQELLDGTYRPPGIRVVMFHTNMKASSTPRSAWNLIGEAAQVTMPAASVMPTSATTRPVNCKAWR
jgi:hypothetical protein